MSDTVLNIRNLTKSFGTRKAVNDLSFQVKQGEIFGFLGPNGAGKSTTIRLMLALIKPDAGDVEVLGKSISKHRNGSLQGVGALIEEPAFYRNLSARANLQILARMEGVPETRLDEVLEIVGLANRGRDKVKAYSHGMKQRLGVAQALLSRPRLLILDEPTSGLDPRHLVEVRELVQNLAREGMTIFLSSHLLHEVEQVCTSLAIINQGKLIITGEVNALLRESDLFTTEVKATPLERAQEIIAAMSAVKKVDRVGAVLKVGIAPQDLETLTKTLVENGIAVQAVIPRTSLEDYFLSLTAEEGV